MCSKKTLKGILNINFFFKLLRVIYLKQKSTSVSILGLP